VTNARSPLSALSAPIGAAVTWYAGLLRTPGAAAFFYPAALARLGAAMTGLGLLLSVRHATGSYAVAGAATGIFALAEAAAGPQSARLVDRWGQGVFVPTLVICHAASITLAILFAATANIPATLIAVGVAGAGVPQPGALSAARWSHLLTEPRALRTAFSLEASVNDVAFLAGPVAVTLASGLIVPWAGSAAAAAFLLIGCLLLAGRRRTAPPTAARRRHRDGRRRSTLLNAAFLTTLGVNLGLGFFFGAVSILVTAAAGPRLESVTGPILALSSAASLGAGLAYGALRAGPRPQLLQLAAATLLVVAVAEGALWSTLAGFSIMLVVGGSAIAPLIASSSQIVQASIAQSELTQGFTWINTASAAGIAGAAAVTGAVVQTAGVHTAASLLVALTGVALVCAAVGAVRVRAGLLGGPHAERLRRRRRVSRAR
jgi:hypothetical protein